MNTACSRRTPSLPLILLVLLGVAWPLPAGAARPKPRIDELHARWDQDRALVSFQLSNALTAETLERIHSGIPVTFRYRVDLLAPRGFRMIPPKRLARTLVQTSVEYDALTRRYALLRTLEVKSRRKRDDADPTEQRRSTGSHEEMRVWMTELTDIVLLDPKPQQSRELRIRVESALGRRYQFLIFPTTVGAAAELMLER